MMRGASIFGGNWDNDEFAGSRYANVDNWPDNSNEWIGARGRSDDQYCLKALSLGASYGRTGFTHHSGARPDWWSARSSCFGEHIARSGRTGRSAACRVETRGRSFFHRSSFNCRERHVAKHYRNLIGAICSDSNMREALRLTALGKRFTPGYLEFKEFAPLNLEELARDMRTGTFVQGKPHEFRIVDPKPRLISALPFRDRVAQQALCLVIGPIFDRLLLPRCYASRKGKGTHAGVRDVQATLRRLERLHPGRPIYVLKTDFSRSFASIERPVLWRLIDKKISCRATRALLEAMVPREGIGLPIGSLTSQVLANLYTGATLDRLLQQELGETDWFRYMDDLVVLGTSSEHLRALKDAIERFAAAELGLRFSKWSVSPATRGINFLGYRIWSTHKLLRRDSVVRAKRKIAAYRAAGDSERLERFLGAWLGHASHANTRNLARALGVDGA